MAKHNLQTLGTWVAALVVIPGLCSLAVKPFMDKIKPKNEEPKKLDVTSQTIEIEPVKTPSTSTAVYPLKKISISGFTNTGMKV